MTKLTMIGAVEVYTKVPVNEVAQYLRNGKMNCIEGSATPEGATLIHINLSNVLYIEAV